MGETRLSKVGDVECTSKSPPPANQHKQTDAPAERTIYIGSKPSRLTLTSVAKARSQASQNRITEQIQGSSQGEGKEAASRAKTSGRSTRPASQGPCVDSTRTLAVYIGPKRSRSTSTHAGRLDKPGLDAGPQKGTCVTSYESSKQRPMSAGARDLDAGNAKSLVTCPKSARLMSVDRCSQTSASEGRTCDLNAGGASLSKQASRTWINKSWQAAMQTEASCSKAAMAPDHEAHHVVSKSTTPESGNDLKKQPWKPNLRGWRWGEQMQQGHGEVPVPSKAIPRISLVSALALDGTANPVGGGALTGTTSVKSLAAAIQKMGLPHREAWDWPLSREESALRVQVLSHQVLAAE